MMPVMELFASQRASECSCIVAFAVQAYFWGIWAAYCSVMARSWAASATYPIVYYFFVLSACASPITWMSQKEMATARSAAEALGIVRGTVLYSLIAVVAYLIFTIWPTTRETIYGWIAQ
jgi:hypothetical protein